MCVSHACVYACVCVCVCVRVCVCMRSAHKHVSVCVCVCVCVHCLLVTKGEVYKHGRECMNDEMSDEVLYSKIMWESKRPSSVLLRTCVCCTEECWCACRRLSMLLCAV